jgi:hypothetical protein
MWVFYMEKGSKRERERERDTETEHKSKYHSKAQSI